MADLQKYRASELEKARTADLLRLLPKHRSTLLDIGAREGYFSKLLTKHFASVTALDLKKPRFEYPGIVTVAGDVTKLDFADEAFDCTFCTEVGACQRLLDRCSRNLVSFLFLVPIPSLSQKKSRREAAGATIASSLDPQHPGFCQLHFMRAAC